MKRLIITTILLTIAAIAMTLVYFKNLKTTGEHTSLVMQTIPDDASLIFQFNNDKGFYDIFTGSKLMAAVAGEDKIAGFNALHHLVLQDPLFREYFDGENIYLSLHPQKGNDADLLITTSFKKGFDPDVFEQLAKHPQKGMVVNTIKLGGKPGYTIYLNDLKKRFYLIVKDDNTISGSFSKDLADECAQYKGKKDEKAFVQLSDQQNSNSLANLYINYKKLSPLFEQVFLNKNPDIFKSFRQLPALAALTINYKSDAFMFTGYTYLQDDSLNAYLSLFIGQQPVINHLKDIFPSTTAYCMNLAVSDPQKFEKALAVLETRNDHKNEKKALLDKVKAETGVNILPEFNRALGNEFAVVTTRYQEKIAIIQLKDGSNLLPVMLNISSKISDDSGQLNYEKLPSILLGDAFNIFKRPYFRIIDNYLILTNSESEMASYRDSYLNHKFLSKMEEYNQFDGLLSERSNVAFLVQFKNARQTFKQDMKPGFYDDMENRDPGWKDFYAASYQFTASDKNYYTNFCMRLQNDTLQTKR